MNNKNAEIVVENKRKLVKKTFAVKDKQDELTTKRMIDFSIKYDHPFLVSLVRHELIDSQCIMYFEYAEGIPILEFLKKNPHNNRELWLKLLDFIRYLSYHSIFLSDLKPEHIFVNQNKSMLDIKIIDITVDENIVNSKWSAPEQFQGQVTWKSNLYTVALIFASTYFKLPVIKERIARSEVLSFPESSILKDRYTDFLDPIPELRIDDVEGYLLKMGIYSQHQRIIPSKYGSFLEFHDAICDLFYSNRVSLELSYDLYRKYCNPNNIKKITDYNSIKYTECKFISLSEILRNEDIDWGKDQITWKNSVTETYSLNKDSDAIFNDLKSSFSNWDFKRYRYLFNYFLDNLELTVNLEIEDLIWFANILRREGLKDKARKMLNHYIGNNILSNNQICMILLTWKDLFFFDQVKPDFPIVIDSEFLDSLNKEMVDSLKLLEKVNELYKNQHFSELEKILHSLTDTNDIKMLIVAILNYTVKKNDIDFINQSIDLAIEDNNPYYLINLLSIRQYLIGEINDKNWEYIIILSLSLKSTHSIFVVLNRLFSLAINKKDISLLKEISRLYGKSIVKDLRKDIKSHVLSQKIYYNFLIENYYKAEAEIKNNIHDILDEKPYVLFYYLEIKMYNRDYIHDKNMIRVLKTNSKTIKKMFPMFIKKLKHDYFCFASSYECEQFEKIFRLKLKERDSEHFAHRFEKLYAFEKYDEIIRLHDNINDESIYNTAESFYYYGLALYGKGYSKQALFALKDSLRIFNDLGLYNRCSAISELINQRTKNQKNEDAFSWKQILYNLNNSKTINEFIWILESFIYEEFGFETVIPFLYDSSLNTFTPIGQMEKNFFESYDGMVYSSRILKEYSKNKNVTFQVLQNFTLSSKSIHRLEIKNAYCFPMIVNGELLGTLYLHSKYIDRVLVAESLNDLEVFSPVIGNILRYLYIKSLTQITKVYDDSDTFHGLVGRSESMKQLKEQILKIAPLPYSVLIEGESGVGKELVAKAFYEEGSYKGKFVIINCTTIPKDLFESEIFGHKKGAFSGAFKDKKGKIDGAENGVIFFDEIGELSIDLQIKLLRILQERTYSPVGSNEEKKTNARFIFATNRDLLLDVNQKIFRADLFARIKQFVIKVPPLRKHIEDIPILAEHFVQKFCETNPGFQTRPILLSQIQKWKKNDWSMNIREFEYEVYRYLITTQDVKKEPLPCFEISPENIKSTKDLTKQYIIWLSEILESPRKVMEKLGISKATYYRLIK